ncbi:MAG TPA: hypothetical protein PKY81_05550 [bacterium]|nr:hypothetical protein [bacterium]HPN30402.1 hypothetical protein [bacterium]
MPKPNNNYFWDYSENSSEVFKLKRIFEYASFPDLIKISFKLVKKYIGEIDLKNLRTSNNRIEFLELVKKKSQKSNSWEDVIFKN